MKDKYSIRKTWSRGTKFTFTVNLTANLSVKNTTTLDVKISSKIVEPSF